MAETVSAVLALIAIGVAIMIGGITQAEWKNKWLINGMIGAGVLIILIGVGFPWFRTWMPRLAELVADIATNPASWFSILILILSGHLLLRGRRADFSEAGCHKPTPRSH